MHSLTFHSEQTGSSGLPGFIGGHSFIATSVIRENVFELQCGPLAVKLLFHLCGVFQYGPITIPGNGWAGSTWKNRKFLRKCIPKGRSTMIYINYILWPNYNTKQWPDWDLRQYHGFLQIHFTEIIYDFIKVQFLRYLAQPSKLFRIY